MASVAVAQVPTDHDLLQCTRTGSGLELSVSAWRHRLDQAHARTIQRRKTSRQACEELVAQVSDAVKDTVDSCDKDFSNLRASLRTNDENVAPRNELGAAACLVQFASRAQLAAEEYQHSTATPAQQDLDALGRRLGNLQAFVPTLDVVKSLERCGRLICAAEDQLCSPIDCEQRISGTQQTSDSSSLIAHERWKRPSPHALLEAINYRCSLVLLRLCMLAWRTLPRFARHPPQRPVKRNAFLPFWQQPPLVGLAQVASKRTFADQCLAWVAPEGHVTPPTPRPDWGSNAASMIPSERALGDAADESCLQSSFSSVSTIRMLQSGIEEEGMYTTEM